MAKRIYTGITDRNDFKVYTGDIVKMHYFCLGICGSGGVYEDETEVIGKVKVHWYNSKKEPQFCVEDSNGNKYPFSLMQEPSEEIEIKHITKW